MQQNKRAFGAYPVILLTVGHFVSDFYANFLPMLLPFMMGKMGLTLTMAGVLTMIYSLTSNLLQPVCGYLADRQGWLWPIIITMPISGWFISFIGITENIMWVFVFVGIAGIGSSLFHPLGSSLMGQVTKPEKRGLAMAMFIGGGNLGYALSPLLLMAFFQRWGEGFIWWLAIPSVFLAWLYYRAGFHISGRESRNRQSSEELQLFSSGMMRPVLWLNLVMGLRSWVQVAVGTFLPTLGLLAGMPDGTGGTLLAVFLLGGVAGALAGGHIGDQFGHRRIIMGAFIIGFLGMGAFLFLPITEKIAWIMLFISGAALQGTMPSSLVWAQEMLPKNAAMASGMMLGLSYGLGGVGTALTAVVADHIGLVPALLWTLLPLIVALPILGKIPEKNQI